MDLDPPPPYEPPSGPGDDDSPDISVDISVDVSVDDSFDDNDPGVNWARNHLLEARAALASYPEAKRALKRQVLEEQEMIRLGIDHHGPPPAHAPRTIVPPWKDGSMLTDVVPTSSIFGPGNIEAELDQALDFQEFGYMNVMPGLPDRRDPLKNAFGGVETKAVRNPSIKWGAMVPRQHFPGAEVEGVIPEMQSTPEFVIIRRHVCGTQCPEGCHEGGGVRRKGKGRPVAEIGDIEGGEAMEGVVFAHWGDDDFDESEESGSDLEQKEKLREQQELETIETLEHCTIIERHRRKWAAEIGALTFKARIISEKLPSISLNTKEPSHESERVYEPSFVLAGKMMNRLDEQRKKEEELKQEKARLARIRIAKWRAAMAGRDTSKIGDDAGEAMFQSLVDNGDLAALENDPDNESRDGNREELATGGNDDGSPGRAPRSPPDKDDSAERRKQEKSRLAKIRLAEWRAAMAGQNTTEMGDEAGEAVLKPIDDSPGPSAVTENAPTSDIDEAMPPLPDSHPTVKSTEEVVSDLAEEEDTKMQETAQEDVPEEIRSLEATSQETAVEESIAQALIAQAAIVRDATTPDLTLEDTPIPEPAPKETTSVEATPEDATSEKSAPKEAATEDATAETPAPKEAAPEDTTSEKSAPKETASEDTTPEKSAPKEATREEATTQEDIAEETSAQENLGPGPGPSRKRPAPNKSSLKRRPAKRQSIRESPFLDASEREAPPTWILQRDGRLIRNPLAGAPGYRRLADAPGYRRWSDPEIDAPVPMPSSDLEPRPRSATISEGTEPPVPRCSAEDTIPTVGEEGQMTEHVEVVDESPALPSPAEWSLADRESMPPPPSPLPRKRSLAVSEGSPYMGRLWSSEDMFPSMERSSRAARPLSPGGDSAADVTSLAPARASTPEPPQMSREQIRSSAQALANLLGPPEERFRDPNIGIIIVRTNPRMADLRMRYRPTRAPSVLRMEILVDEEALEVENAARRARELERGVFASRVPDPPRYDLHSRSGASSESPSPVTPSIFSGETSGRSTEATSATLTPTGSGELTGEAVAAGGVAEDRNGRRVVERVVERVLEGVYLPSSPALAVDRLVVGRDRAPAVDGGEGVEATNLWREASTGSEGSTGREGSMESLGSTGRARSIGREGSIATEVAETLGGLAVESASESIGREGSITTEVAETLGGLAVDSESESEERVREAGGPEEGSGVLGRVLPSTEVPEEAIEDDGDGAPLAKVSSHSSTHSL
ncbi:hypothetical protein VE00_03832 [Pseudogymnoascus sp. WSF 3629]|nr:hypothetical protein VE00_03832 [Pseudogymnoascus sp. WSF 3629]